MLVLTTQHFTDEGREEVDDGIDDDIKAKETYLEFFDLSLELCNQVLFVFEFGVETVDFHVFPESQ